MPRTIWITGAGRGIGRAAALLTVKKHPDCFLAVNSRSGSEIFALEDELKKMHANVLAMEGDVSKESDRQSMLNRIHETSGGVDVLINNAGISVVKPLQCMSGDEINQLMEINLLAPVRLSAMVIPDLLKSQNHPRIINISSVWGSVGASCETVYSASKGGINAFTKALSKELAPSRIPVNAVACGLIDTTMNAHLSLEEMSSLCDEIPAGRAGTPAEAARLICALLDADEYLTGQIVTLDGGWI